jgi:hypothetical protein
MRSEQDGAAFSLKGANERPEITPGLGIKACSRFIKKEKFWIADDAESDI